MFPQHTGEWISAEVEFDLPRRFSLETQIETRTLNSPQFQVYTNLLQLGLKYKLSSHFDLGYTYRFEWQREDNRNFYYRNKMMFDFKSDYPLGRFKFRYRARFRRLARTYIEDGQDLLPDWHWQNRLEISYNLPKTSLEPTLYGELFTPLNASRPAYFDQKRLGAELSYSLTKKQSIRAGGFYVNVPFQTWRRGVVFQLGWKYSVG